MKSELVDLLESLIKPCSQAALRRNKKADASSVLSKFGGKPYFEAPNKWPICTGCNAPLTFICQINTADCKHPVTVNALYTFFYCWQCSPWGLSDEKKGLWKISRYLTPEMAKIVERIPTPEPKYPTTACFVEFSLGSALPDWDGIYSINPQIANLSPAANAEEPWQAYEDACQQLHCLDDYATRIGGYPKWIQGDAEASCLICSKPMNFFAQIDSEEKADIGWGDTGCVYLFQCLIHPDEFHLELQCY